MRDRHVVAFAVQTSALNPYDLHSIRSLRAFQNDHIALTICVRLCGFRMVGRVLSLRLLMLRKFNGIRVSIRLRACARTCAVTFFW